MGRFRRLFPEISSSSDNATDVSVSGFLTVCCSPQLPAAIAHHVVWKPLRLTAAIHSCEVLGCLWGLHRAALPCHSLLDRSLQQGTNSWWCVGLTGIFTQGLEWNPRFFHKVVEKVIHGIPQDCPRGEQADTNGTVMVWDSSLQGKKQGGGQRGRGCGWQENKRKNKCIEDNNIGVEQRKNGRVTKNWK